MKRLVVFHVLLICCAFALLSCTKSKPDESQLAKDLSQALNYRQQSSWGSQSDHLVNEFVVLADCKKENGLSKSEKEYILEFSGHLKVIKPFYSVAGHWPMFPNNPNYGGSSSVRYEVGQLLSFKGSASYVLTEKGWKVTKIDAPMVAPNNQFAVFFVPKQSF